MLTLCVLKCGLKFECYQTCGLTHVTKCVLKCVLFSAVLILYVRSFLRSSNKKCGLNPALPKTCGLKSANISVNKSETPSFAQHIFIDLATCHYSLRSPSPLAVAPHPGKVTPNFAIFKISSFRVVHAQIHFFLLAQKYPFSTPQNSTYIRATDLQTRFLRSTDSVDSSDTLVLRYRQIGRVIEVVPNMWSLNVVLIFACGLANKIC